MSLLREFLIRFKFQVDNRGKLTGMARELDGVKAKFGGVPPAANRASASLRKTEVQATHLGSTLGGLGSKLTGFLGGLGLTLGGAGLIKELVDSNITLERLKASLETSEGSVDGAAEKFDQLRQFAGEVPASIEEVTQSYLKLENMGLDSSVEAMRAYSDVASALPGKSVNDFVEAVADAVTGENERLKEFGIKAKDAGNQVKFTFAGQTTTVKKNADAIQKYLMGIGQNNFGGASAKQMNTLGGRFAALKNTIFDLATAIGEAGFNDWLRALTERITKLTERIKKFASNGDRVKKVLAVLTKVAKGAGIAFGLIVAGKTLDMVAKGVSAVRLLGNTAALAQSKFLLLPAAVLGVFMVLEDLYGFTQGKKSVFGDMLESQGIDSEPIRQAFNGIGEGAASIWEGASEGAKAFLGAFGIDSWKDVADVLERVWHAIKEIGYWLLEKLGIETPEKFAEKMKLLGGAFGEALKQVGLFGRDVAEKLKEVLGPAFEWVTTKVAEAFGALKNLEEKKRQIAAEKIQIQRMNEDAFNVRAVQATNGRVGSSLLSAGDLDGAVLPSQAIAAMSNTELRLAQSSGKLDRLLSASVAEKDILARSLTDSMRQDGALGVDLGGYATPQKALAALSESERGTQREKELQSAARFIDSLVASKTAELVSKAEAERIAKESNFGGAAYGMKAGAYSPAAVTDDRMQMMALASLTSAPATAPALSFSLPHEKAPDLSAFYASEGVGTTINRSVSVASPSIVINGVVPQEIIGQLETTAQSIFDRAVEQAFEDTAEATE